VVRSFISATSVHRNDPAEAKKLIARPPGARCSKPEIILLSERAAISSTWEIQRGTAAGKPAAHAFCRRMDRL
jgi:hypothetical protein